MPVRWASACLVLLASLTTLPVAARRTASQKARGAEATRLNRAGFRKPDGTQFSRRDILLPRKLVGTRAKTAAVVRRERQLAVTRFIAEFVSDYGPAANKVRILSVENGNVRFTAPGFEGEISLRREEGWVLDHATGRTERVW
jgi:hypothetical protein